MPTLYIVATPIGNLGDITIRALQVLKNVDVIACEDTRVTKKLLFKYKIQKQLFSYHSHSTRLQTEKVFEALRRGKSIALVSDAGTPGISDPGSKLVSEVRNEIPEVEIIALPGANAAISALSISGFPSSEFLFLGFLPHKKGRETLFKKIADTKQTIVFYESPHRIMKTLSSLCTHLPKTRKVGIAKELSKIHEEFITGNAREVFEYFTKNKDKVRGEFVVLVSG